MRLFRRDPKVSVRPRGPGEFVLDFSNGKRVILDVYYLNVEEKFDAIRWSILDQGFVFTEKLDKKLRKMLDMR